MGLFRELKVDLFNSWKIIVSYVGIVTILVALDSFIFENADKINNEIIQNILIGVGIVSSIFIGISSIVLFVILLYNLLSIDKAKGITSVKRGVPRLLFITFLYLKVLVLETIVYTIFSKELTFYDIFLTIKEFILQIELLDLIAFAFIIILVATVLLNVYFILASYILKLRPTKIVALFQILSFVTIFLAASVFFTPYQLAAYLLLLLSFGATILCRYMANHVSIRELILPAFIIALMVPLAFVYNSQSDSNGFVDSYVDRPISVDTYTYTETNIKTPLGDAILIDENGWKRMYYSELDLYIDTSGVDFTNLYSDNLSIYVQEGSYIDLYMSTVDIDNNTKDSIYAGYNIEDGIDVEKVISDLESVTELSPNLKEFIILYLDTENRNELNKIMQ